MVLWLSNFIFTCSFSVQPFPLTAVQGTWSNHFTSAASFPLHINSSPFLAWLNKLMAQNSPSWAQMKNKCIKNSHHGDFAWGVISWLVFIQCFEDQCFHVYECRYNKCTEGLLIVISHLLCCYIILRAVTNQCTIKHL